MLERIIATYCLVIDQLIFLNHSQNRLCTSVVRQSFLRRDVAVGRIDSHRWLIVSNPAGYCPQANQ